MPRYRHFLIVILGGLAALGMVTAGTAQTGRTAAQPAPAAATPCVDGEGPSYGFFCAPRVQNRGVTACAKNLSGIALTQCREASANTFCQSAGFTRAVLFEVNAQGQLAEVTCNGRTAPATLAAAAPMSTPAPASAPQPGDNYAPMFDTDLFGSDLASSFEFKGPGATWQQCAAACDKDRNCKAFTFVVPGRTQFGECFLKNPVPEPSYGGCCISGVKGVGPTAASATGGQTAAAASDRARGNVYDTDFNDMEITRWDPNGVFEGRYEYAGGRLTGTAKGSVVTGYWVQELSPIQCPTQRAGSFYYGRFTLSFNADRTAFSGTWSHCEDAPSATNPWNGQLLRSGGSASSARPAAAGNNAGQPRTQRQETVADRLAREAADEAEQRAREETRRGVRGLLNRVIRPD